MGFFDLPKQESTFREHGKVVSCQACGLYQHVKTPRMEPFGNFKKGILNIGEFPEEIEDDRGKQWQGKSGRLLQRTYKKLGIDLFEDCLNINSINCRPMNKNGKNRTPTDYEIACCRSRVWKVIKESKPKLIVSLGTAPITSLLGHRWKKNLGGITKWRGWQIPDRDMNCWFCPTYHPSYIQHLDTDEVTTIWEQDLKAAFAMLEEPFPTWKDDLSCVHLINNIEELPPFPAVIAFDFETTGIKPHAKGHRIICASVAYNENESYAFMMPPSPKERKRFSEMLENPNIKKIAHNMKFEDTWSKIRLRNTVQGWYWDSMLAAHILDNRPGITSLKFQTYISQGIVDYDSEISPYLKGKDSKNSNSHNRILELLKLLGGKEKLLTYCALDSLYTYRLSILQMKEIGI